MVESRSGDVAVDELNRAVAVSHAFLWISIMGSVGVEKFPYASRFLEVEIKSQFKLQGKK